jgi:GxxExxY protein
MTTRYASALNEGSEDYFEDIYDRQIHDTDTFRVDVNTMVNEIYNTLGSGHSERVYHNAMEVSLRELNIPYESERHVPIYYKEHVVGMARADIIVRKTTVLEFKTVKSLNDAMISQAKKYLTQLKLQTAYLINFPPGENQVAEIVEVKRSV